MDLKNINITNINIFVIFFKSINCSFLFQNFGDGVENNPVRSSISDQCYFYAKYDKNASTRSCF